MGGDQAMTRVVTTSCHFLLVVSMKWKDHDRKEVQLLSETKDDGFHRTCVSSKTKCVTFTRDCLEGREHHRIHRVSHEAVESEIDT